MIPVLISVGIVIIVVAILWPKSHNIPGPRGYPLIGNVFDMPQSNASESFAKMRAVLIPAPCSPYLWRTDYGIETWRYCLSFRIRPRDCSSQLPKSSNGYPGHPSRGICRPTSADNGIRAVSHFSIILASALSCFQGPDTTGSLLSTNIRTAIALAVHTSTVQLVLSTPEITHPLRRNNQSGSSGSSWRIQTSLKSTVNGITPSSPMSFKI